MPVITSKSGKSYEIPVFTSLTPVEYKNIIYAYKLLLASQMPKPPAKPPPKSRDTYYE